MATVTHTIEEWQELINKGELANRARQDFHQSYMKQIDDLKAELSAARIGSPDSEIAKLVIGMTAASPLVSQALAYSPHDRNDKWPWAELAAYAKAFAAMPGATDDDIIKANDLLAITIEHARDAAKRSNR